MQGDLLLFMFDFVPGELGEKEKDCLVDVADEELEAHMRGQLLSQLGLVDLVPELPGTLGAEDAEAQLGRSGAEETISNHPGKTLPEGFYGLRIMLPGLFEQPVDILNEGVNAGQLFCLLL